MKTSDYRAPRSLLVGPRGTIYKLLCGSLAVLPLALGMGLHSLQPRNPPNPRSLFAGTTVDGKVMHIFQQSCGDCHSDNTVWPWYSNVAPLSWMIENDVQKGRRAMNLSNWQNFTTGERQAFLREMVPMVQNQLMPLPQYTAIHRNSKVSGEAIAILSAWAAEERHRLRQTRISNEDKSSRSDLRSSEQ